VAHATTMASSARCSPVEAWRESLRGAEAALDRGSPVGSSSLLLVEFTLPLLGLGDFAACCLPTRRLRALEESDGHLMADGVNIAVC
jgi:hypothetical protein